MAGLLFATALFPLGCDSDDPSGPGDGSAELDVSIRMAVTRTTGEGTQVLDEPAQFLPGDGVAATLVLTNVGDRPGDVQLTEWRWGPVGGAAAIIVPVDQPPITLLPGGQLTDVRHFTIALDAPPDTHEMRWSYALPDTVFVRGFSVSAP